MNWKPAPFRVSFNTNGWFAERQIGTYTEILCEDSVWRSDCTKNSIYFTYAALLLIIGRAGPV